MSDPTPEPLKACEALSDGALASRLESLIRNEKRSLALLIAHLAEFDRRKLYADLGHPSLYAYCTRALGYSEAEATWRIYTARTTRRFPVILDLLDSGVIHMSAVVTLAAHLTEENHRQLLEQAGCKTRREVEVIVAAMAPEPERADCVWYLSGPEASGQPAAASEQGQSPPAPSARPYSAREMTRPFAPGRVRIRFDAGEPFFKKLERTRQLLRHKHPAGKLEDVFQETIDLFLEKRDPDRRLRAKESRKSDGLEAESAPQALSPVPGPEPASRTRRIPQAVQDQVWRRDGGRCAFLGPDGARCLEEGGLEFDHVIPWALGGPSNNAENVRLLCRTHNQLLARRAFGEAYNEHS